MDLFASSVLRTLGVLTLAAVLGLVLGLGLGGCVSERGRAVDRDEDAFVPLVDPGEGETLPVDGGARVDASDGPGDAALEVDGGAGADASASQVDPDGSTADPDAQVDPGDPSCERGFVLDGDDCVRDQCEASDDEPAACGDNGQCSDGTQATPTCDCDEGYVLAGTQCVRDLCQASEDDPAACGDHGSCSDGTEAVPTCECDEGYVLEAFQCVRNPCIPLTDDPVPCDDDATCTYEGEGAASCECDLGYDGDGETCQRNACVQLSGEGPPCAANQACTPTGDGTKSCNCEDGFDDCDDSPSNGCEAELAVNEDHCGACGLECAAGLACDAGVCGKRVTEMALGYSVAIGTLSDGTVFGAGYGGAMLRDHVTSSIPVLLSLYDASQVTVNTNHACLVRADGMGAACWGSNANYQLGGAATNDTYEDLALPGVRAIAAGAVHTCVVADNERVYCWGQGDVGQLGNGVAQSGGTRTYSATFAGAGVPVLNVTGAIDVRAGSNLSCALMRTGHVSCWGTFSSTIYAPEPVSNASGTTELSDAVEICGGSAHACALRADKTVACWGSDSAGQLGSGTDPSGRNRWVPVALTDVSAIACGNTHTCALRENGEAHCWGQNSSGQLGTGDTMPSTEPAPVPVLLPAATQARAIYAGSGAVGTCFELTTGQVLCAGYNYYGQLGNGTSGAQQPTPTEITSWP